MSSLGQALADGTLLVLVVTFIAHQARQSASKPRETDTKREDEGGAENLLDDLPVRSR